MGVARRFCLFAPPVFREQVDNLHMCCVNRCRSWVPTRILYVSMNYITERYNRITFQLLHPTSVQFLFSFSLAYNFVSNLRTADASTVASTLTMAPEKCYQFIANYGTPTATDYCRFCKCCLSSHSITTLCA